MSALLEQYGERFLDVFGAPQLALVSGEGCRVTDADGATYLDLLGGIAVNSLGHGHPDLAGAIARQARSLIHVSNFFTTEQAVELGGRLLALAEAPKGSRVFLANSGTEAIEAAVKLSRRTGRTGIVALEGAFHGRTTGALALTHKAAYRDPFAPLIPGVTHVPPGDVPALEAVVGADTAAIVLEPIQGEAGVRELPDDYLRAARRLADENGALLVVDEIQTGVGRTGEWFAHTRAGITPDVMLLAKGLAGGVPIGAMLTFGPRVSALLQPGQHGTTFGGNPLACAASLAVLEVIERDDLLGNARRVGDHLRERLAALECVTEVRGRGLLLAVELAGREAPRVAREALTAGFIVNPVTPTALRLAPPLVLTQDEADSFVDALPGIVAAADGGAWASRGGVS